MKNKDIPVNRIAICVSISEDGDPLTQAMHNFSESYPVIEQDYLSLLLKGLEFIIHASPDFSASVGNLTEMLEQGAVEFEAADELKDAIADAKVVPINKNRMN